MSTPTLTLNPLSLPPPSIEKLHHLTTLLHLFHHRNNNQHRHSIWWRLFCLFRREMIQLTRDIDLYTTAPTTHLERARKKTRDASLLATTEKRIEFWKKVMVPKWHHAFSQLVADGRFAVLGVVLMAILAEVCEVTGINGWLEEEGQREVEKVLEEFGREEWGLEKAGLGGKDVVVNREDRGEVVVRREEDERESMVVEKASTAERKMDQIGGVVPIAKEDDEGKYPKEIPTAMSSATKSDSTSSQNKTAKASDLSKPSKKKKRRKGDAIDDLFNF